MQFERHGRRLAGLAMLLIGLGSADPAPPEPAADPAAAPRTKGSEPSPPPDSQPRRLDLPGIDNLYQLAPGLYSGAQPEGRAGFASLQRLGVKTVVSVDGARPNLEEARRFGVRYVHLPIGYDGVGREQAVRLAKAALDLPGPLFIHCHHGQHRGPTAAALCALATADWNRKQARDWLVQAGADPKYQGLYAALDQFTPPTPQELAHVAPGDLRDQAEVPSLVETMVQIDECWDRLRAGLKTGLRSVPVPDSDSPKLDPAHEATVLAELFREAVRNDESPRRGRDFNRLMNDAGRHAAALETAILGLKTTELDSASAPAMETAVARLRQDCTTCHARYRDTPDPQ